MNELNKKMNIKKILKILKIIYKGLKIYFEFVFRLFVIMILLQLSIVLGIMTNLSNYARFGVIMSLLFFTVRPILTKIEWKFFRRHIE